MFKALLQAEGPMTPESLWENIKAIVLKASKAHIPKLHKQQQSEWITTDTWKAVEKK